MDRSRAFRHSLLAEHLGVSPDAVARELDKDGSLIGTVERLRGGARTLGYFDGTVSADVNEVVPDEAFIDPSGPYDMQFIPVERRKPALRLDHYRYCRSAGVDPACRPLAVDAVTRHMDVTSLVNYVGGSGQRAYGLAHDDRRDS